MVQILNHMTGEFHSRLICAQQGAFKALGAVEALLRALQSPGDHQRRNIVLEDIVIALLPAFAAQVAEVISALPIICRRLGSK